MKHEERGSRIKVPTEGLCCVCNDPTNWIDVNFEAYICHEFCLWELEHEYEMACRRYAFSQ